MIDIVQLKVIKHVLNLSSILTASTARGCSGRLTVGNLGNNNASVSGTFLNP